MICNRSHPKRIAIQRSEGGLHFEDHIFTFMVILDADEEGRIQEPEEYSYRLVAYTKRDNIIPAYIDLDPPVTSHGRLTYLNSLHTMRYHLYLSTIKKVPQLTALVYSNLIDPLSFGLAEIQSNYRKAAKPVKTKSQ